ncbi:hypothetical protein [Cerasicoccus maritimus]|uniref:hypothetical protein n=1 Tax=Cerasicoccus maritimus TaxID=490089 RepID=UPI0028527448|nr:hypothetical protein [Cerasicoccus maritimus]
MLRSQQYANIADRLALTCNASIGDNGLQHSDPAVHGLLSDGNVFYCVGEMSRVRGSPPHEIVGRNYVSILRAMIGRREDIDTLTGCFMAMGLAMLGRDGPRHPVLTQLSNYERAKVKELLDVTRAFPHNWEVFNASMRMARTVLWGDDPELILPHIEKLVRKYEESGYFDDSLESGDYNNYGLMTINFALRLSEFLPPQHDVRTQIESLFRPHALRYVELLKLFIGSHGEGWLFGRSAGVLGQLQCLSFLEQVLTKGWLPPADAAWARTACRAVLQYMEDVFWDDEAQWFSFRDAHRQCYHYRFTLPMTWDLWRYFLQLEHYAKLDEAQAPDSPPVPLSEPVCREVITNTERHTTFLVWSDGEVKWQMPIMGGPTIMCGDNLPRPYLPGLFEWTTGTTFAPALCPEFTVGGKKGWPAWWPTSTKLETDGDNWRYVVDYPTLCDDHGRALDWPMSITVEYRFGSGFFERIDRIHVCESMQLDAARIEVLQGAPHPKSRNYPMVYALNSALQSNLPGVSLSEVDVSADPLYRNYFSHAEKSTMLTGEGIALLPGEYEIHTSLRW